MKFEVVSNLSDKVLEKFELLVNVYLHVTSFKLRSQGAKPYFFGIIF